MHGRGSLIGVSLAEEEGGEEDGISTTVKLDLKNGRKWIQLVVSISTVNLSLVR